MTIMTTGVIEAKKTISTEEMETLRRSVRNAQEMSRNDTVELVAKPNATPRFLERAKQQIARIHRTLLEKQERETVQVTPSIIAVIPAYETEGAVDKAIESLLLQTRQLEKIVVVVNGPGLKDTAYRAALPYSLSFANVTVVWRNVSGKVHALNDAYRNYVLPGEYDFMLGVDADVECDPEMVHYLEKDILDYRDALGVKARYGFLVPDEKLTRRSRSIIYGQRAEFAATEMKQQIRGGRTEILGGQSTLFRVRCLQDIASVSRGGLPWNPSSKVEDAELTRVAQRRGYTARSSVNARAWTGLMKHPYEWHKQRRKWQDGHLEDMTKEFHPIQDARRWSQQFALGWNVSIRVMFATLMVSGVLLDRYVFSPIWLVPIGLSIFQSLLVAIKLPNKSFGELIRSVAFFPGEIYYLRTLSVWLESVFITVLNLTQDGWKKQYAAEASHKRASVSGWVVLSLAVLVPIVLVMTAARFASPYAVSVFFLIGWRVLTAMTVLSIVAMVIFILRMMRQYRPLAP